MQIQKVTLKDLVTKEVDGKFVLQYENEKTYPCFLTNYSLKVGEETGLLKSSLLADLIEVHAASLENDETKLMTALEQNKMQTLIYLGCIGPNNRLELSYDEFVQKFHYSFMESAQIYMKLLESLFNQDTNKLSEGLKNSTKKGKK